MQKQELGIFRIILGSPHLDCVYAFQKHCSFGHWDTQRDKKKKAIHGLTGFYGSKLWPAKLASIVKETFSSQKQRYSHFS